MLLGSRALFTAVQTQKEAIEKKAAGEASPSRSSSSALSLGLAQPVEEDDEQLSEHEALAFAQEGESMLREFTSMLDGIREAEKRILEISRMQVLMETQVLHQATQIDELSSQSVEYALSLTLTLSLTHSLTHTHTNTLVETELINVFSLTDFLFFFSGQGFREHQEGKPDSDGLQEAHVVVQEVHSDIFAHSLARPVIP